MHIQVQLDYSPLLERMREKNITGYQLANYGIPHKTLYNIRNGKIITLETLAKLAYVLDCEINELVRFEYTIIDDELL
ncbi:helix-turn-helix domain-containing protein [Ruminococcus sp. 5_1_39BFAA]|uniref:helix-turn-helix domain-containing protein n=1 Tax=Ruminococcus sp. 5_1_39BFAA TaxID=457412 RepID=UPI003569B21F